MTSPEHPSAHPTSEPGAGSGRHIGLRGAQRVLLVGCVVVGLVLSVASALLVRDYDAEVRAQDHERHGAIVSSRLHSHLGAATDALEAVRPLWTLDPDASHADFLAFVEQGVGTRGGDLSAIAHGITQFSFIRELGPGESEAYLRARRRHFPYSFRHDLDPRTPHYVVDFSVSDPAYIRGFDLYALADRRVVLDRARDTGRPAATAWAPSVADARLPLAHRRRVASVFVPVYGPGPEPRGVEERRERLIGWLAAVFTAEDLAEALARDLPISLEVRDPADGAHAVAAVAREQVRGDWLTQTYHGAAAD